MERVPGRGASAKHLAREFSSQAACPASMGQESPRRDHAMRRLDDRASRGMRRKTAHIQRGLLGIGYTCRSWARPPAVELHRSPVPRNSIGPRIQGFARQFSGRTSGFRKRPCATLPVLLDLV